MSTSHNNLNSIVVWLAAIVMFSLPAGPAMALDKARLDTLFADLQEAEPREAIKLAREIELEYSRSGSATMDLLLKRGRDAYEAGQTDAAIGHLTALTDHAPRFAEGFFYRALAYTQAGLMGPAFADVEQVLHLTPRHFGAIALLGFLMEDMNQPDLAHDAYSRVLELHPHHSDAKDALDRLAPEMRGRDL